MAPGGLGSVVSRRDWGPVPRGAPFLRAAAEARARGAVGVEGRTVYGPPLDGWPFEGGEPSMALAALAALWEAGERARVEGPPFGEVEF